MEGKGIELIQQQIELLVDFDTQSLKCLTSLTVSIKDPEITQIELNARQLKIDKILINAQECTFEYHDPTGFPILNQLKCEAESLAQEYPFLSPMNFVKILSNELRKQEIDRHRPELIINLPSQETSSDQLEIIIEYHIEKPQFGIYFAKDNTLFTVCHNFMGRFLVPCFDQQSLRCPWTIKIMNFSKFGPLVSISIGEVVKNIQDQSNGILFTEYHQAIPCSASDLMIAIGANLKGYSIPNTPISLFFPSGKESLVSLMEEVIVKCFEFNKWFLNFSFPFKSLKIIFIKDYYISGEPATISSNTITFSTALLYQANIVEQQFMTKALVSFTFARLFFGSFVFPKTFNDNWLILGIAHYISRNFQRLLFGNNDYKLQLVHDIEQVCLLDKIKQLPLYSGELIMDSQTMEFVAKKGSLVLHLIEQKLEKALLQKILNSILVEFTSGEEFKNGISTHQFFKLIRKMSGKDLKATSDQWIFNSGCPIFNCSFSFNRSKHVLELNLRQITQSSSCSSFDEAGGGGGGNRSFYGQLIVRVFEAEGVYDHVLQIDENSLYFELPVYTRTKKKPKKRRPEDEDPSGSSALPSIESQQDLQVDSALNAPQAQEDEDSFIVTNPVEWVLIDPELNWISIFNITSGDFQWGECLEAERDVISQHQAIKSLCYSPLTEGTPIILEQALVNWKNFFKIRVEAVISLSSMEIAGIPKLIDFFGKKFCFYPTNKIPPTIHSLKPNDFDLLQNNFIQKMTTLSIGLAYAGSEDLNVGVQGQVLGLLLSCLSMNDNSENQYSDVDYISTVFFALTCIIDRRDDPLIRARLNDIMEEAHRYLFLDQIYSSFHNAITVSVVGLLKKLQVMNYIPVDFSFYTRLIDVGNFIDVRISAVEAICLFGCRNQDVILGLVSAVEFDSCAAFKASIARFLAEACRIDPRCRGLFEENVKIKESFLHLLSLPLVTSIKISIVAISQVYFSTFSIPEMEESEDEEDEELVESPPEYLIDTSTLEENILKSPEPAPKKRKRNSIHISIPEETPELFVRRIKGYFLGKLNSFPDAHVFKYPVDPDTPNYYDIIQNPIDLTKISQTKYATIHDFFADLILLLRNCFTFNDHNSSVASCGKKVRNMLFREIRKMIPSNEQETIIGMIKKGTDIPPEMPLIRYCMLQLTNNEEAQALTTEFNDLRDKVENFRTFEDFAHAVETIIPSTNSALTHFFDDLLTTIGKKKIQVQGKGRKKASSLIDSIVSKVKIDTENVVYKACQDILLKLITNDYSFWFRSPVDPVALGIEDYFDVIKNPMDLDTIDTKLAKKEYETVEDFENDIVLVFENCYTYNKEGTKIHEDARYLEKWLLREWPKMKEKARRQYFGGGSKIIIDLNSSDSLFPQIEKVFYSNISPLFLHNSIQYSLWSLASQSFSEPFLYPVSLLITSYYNIIKNPISLIKMEEKFLSHNYRTFRDFEKDLELLLKNCYFFNQSSTFVYQMGKKLETFYLGDICHRVEVEDFSMLPPSLSSHEAQKAFNALGKLEEFVEFVNFQSRSFPTPFSWNLISQKLQAGMYYTFGGFLKDVSFFFNFSREATPASDKEALSWLDLCKKYFDSCIHDEEFQACSGSSSNRQGTKIKLVIPSSSAASTKGSDSGIPKIRLCPTDISKIPPTPPAKNSHVVVQILQSAKPNFHSNAPKHDESLCVVSTSDPQVSFRLNVLFEKLIKTKGYSLFLENIQEIHHKTMISREFSSLDQPKFAFDSLVYNCKLNNPPDSAAVKAAIKLSSALEKEFSEILKNASSLPSLPPEDACIQWEDSEERKMILISILDQLSSYLESESIKISVISSISKRLSAGQEWKNCQQVIDHVYGIFFQIMAANPINSSIYAEALKAQSQFEELCYALRKDPSTFTPISPDLVKDFIRILQSHELAAPFVVPVDVEALGIPKYRDMIRRPMDFQTLASREYLLEEEFLEDLQLIFKNCCTFNLVTSEIWKTSKILWEYSLAAWSIYKEKAEKFTDILGMNREILLYVLREIQNDPISIPFRFPVDLQAYPTYSRMIKVPMDLQTLEILLQEGGGAGGGDSIETAAKFFAQIKLITKNCIKFNGKDAEISKAAVNMEMIGEKLLSRYFYLKKTNK